MRIKQRGLAAVLADTYLNLSGNPWVGTMPSLDTLTNLITLSLWGCSLTGPIHDSVYRLTKLQILDLAENRLTGTISSAIGNLNELQYLTFSATS